MIRRLGPLRSTLAGDSGATVRVMPADDATPLEPWMVEALVSALRSVGCPADTARELARGARVDRPPHSSDEFLVLLGGLGVGVALPVQPGHFEEAIWSLA